MHTAISKINKFLFEFNKEIIQAHRSEVLDRLLGENISYCVDVGHFGQVRVIANIKSGIEVDRVFLDVSPVLTSEDLKNGDSREVVIDVIVFLNLSPEDSKLVEARLKRTRII